MVPTLAVESAACRNGSQGMRTSTQSQWRLAPNKNMSTMGTKHGKYALLAGNMPPRIVLKFLGIILTFLSSLTRYAELLRTSSSPGQQKQWVHECVSISVLQEGTSLPAKHVLPQFSPVLLTCIAIADKKWPVNSPRTCSIKAMCSISHIELCSVTHISYKPVDLAPCSQLHQITSTAGSSHEP
jgi:hypothetical protein